MTSVSVVEIELIITLQSVEGHKQKNPRMWGFIYLIILNKIKSIFKNAYKVVTIQKPTT